MIHCEDEAEIPKPAGEGDEIQFLTPLGMSKVACKYIRVEYRTRNVKPFSIASHCHTYFMHPRSNWVMIPIVELYWEVNTGLNIGLLNIDQLHK